MIVGMRMINKIICIIKVEESCKLPALVCPHDVQYGIMYFLAFYLSKSISYAYKMYVSKVLLRCHYACHAWDEMVAKDKVKRKVIHFVMWWSWREIHSLYPTHDLALGSSSLASRGVGGSSQTQNPYRYSSPFGVHIRT